MLSTGQLQQESRILLEHLGSGAAPGSLSSPFSTLLQPQSAQAASSQGTTVSSTAAPTTTAAPQPPAAATSHLGRKPTPSPGRRAPRPSPGKRAPRPSPSPTAAAPTQRPPSPQRPRLGSSSHDKPQTKEQAEEPTTRGPPTRLQWLRDRVLDIGAALTEPDVPLETSAGLMHGVPFCPVCGQEADARRSVCWTCHEPLWKAKRQGNNEEDSSYPELQYAVLPIKEACAAGKRRLHFSGGSWKRQRVASHAGFPSALVRLMPGRCAKAAAAQQQFTGSADVH